MWREGEGGKEEVHVHAWNRKCGRGAEGGERPCSPGALDRIGKLMLLTSRPILPPACHPHLLLLHPYLPPHMPSPPAPTPTRALCSGAWVGPEHSRTEAHLRTKVPDALSRSTTISPTRSVNWCGLLTG